MKGFITALFDSQKRITWRRLAMCACLQAFSAYALIQGSLDSQTWSWFAGAIAAIYCGGDSAEKVAKLWNAKGSLESLITSSDEIGVQNGG